ncbi:phospholipid carrier-dependent glycosyltransferase [Actinomadura kijaniata]|uniref:phospholipid carrier-dependent glycosyltransferase n=1 Tax=Actinomadura kijaniata TaxID=46161 RepID=UPI003F1A8966
MEAPAGAADAEPDPAPPARGGRRVRARAFARRHWPFLLAALLGVALRAAATLGYRPVMWFPDSIDYLSGAVHLMPSLIRPSGYSLFLAPLPGLAWVAFLQHAMGVGTAVMLYALLSRRGVRPWLAALATVPVLLDAFQVQLEQMVMSDTLFAFLVMAAVTVFLWPRELTRRHVVAGAVLVGLAAVTRTAGLPLVAPLVVFLLARRVPWRTVAAGVATVALMLGGYGVWFAVEQGQFGMNRSTGVFLYGRVAPFADCRKMNVPVEEMPLCLASDPERRSVRKSYIWGLQAPRHRVDAEGFSKEGEALMRSFAVRAIVSQPLDYLAIAGTDLARTFRWGHPTFPDRDTYAYYLFRDRAKEALPDGDRLIRKYDAGFTGTRVVRPYSSFLGTYQRFAYLPGTVLGAFVLLGAVRIARERRAWGGDALLPWAAGVTLLLVPVFTAQFDYRYVLPAVPLIMLAALAKRPG